MLYFDAPGEIIINTVDERPTTKDNVSTDELIRLFSVLSHDLKSPIFSIDGFSELLIGDYQDKLDEEGKDFLNRIRSSAQQMKKVLDDMSHMVKLLARPNARRATPLRGAAPGPRAAARTRSAR